ncbi:MAG TPA: chemotaxis protein CheA [Burkholderiaceae bacterium]|nr:chemotaxis protein CheA [Burkholderiaceae bacterium]
MTIEMSQFFQVFFDEAEELLAEMEKLLLAIDVTTPDSESLHAIFRTAHSIKGGASTFGLGDLTEVTHVLESLLDKIRNGEVALTTAHVDAFLHAKDVLKMQLDGHRYHSAVNRAAVANARTVLQSLSQDAEAMPRAAPFMESEKLLGSSANSPPPERCFRIELPLIAERDIEALTAELGLLGSIAKSMSADGRSVLMLTTGEDIDNIVAICSFIMEPSDLKIALEPGEPLIPEAVAISVQQQEEKQGYGFFEPFQLFDHGKVAAAAEPKEDVLPVAEIETVSLGELAARDKKNASSGEEKGSVAKGGPEKSPASHESSSIRVGIEKVDQLINLVGELVITQAMIEQRTDSLDSMTHERLLDSVSQLTRNTRDLQQAVMSIRMMPMDYVFSRFPRMVRDLATKLEKKIEFVTHGAATELDKGLIERIIDPLTHLVRNSIDHGIELPMERVKAGKNEVGRLSLSAAHQGGNIVIEVTDDGGGLDRAKILRKAHQSGMSLAEDAPDAEVWQLILAPGFSTAEQVTDVSGRGVGMDVVRRNITAMGGVIDIRSSKGFGTTISISLPLTLAILDGMSIKVGNEIYILPLGYVVESLQPASIDIKEISGQGRVVKVRGDYLPLIPLYQVFGIDAHFTDPSQGIVVILESEGRKAALFVDDLVGQQQVVVKNLESNYRKVAGISGATILGDGGVALIIDVASLLRSTRQLKDESILF